LRNPLCAPRVLYHLFVGARSLERLSVGNAVTAALARTRVEHLARKENLSANVTDET